MRAEVVLVLESAQRCKAMCRKTNSTSRSPWQRARPCQFPSTSLHVKAAKGVFFRVINVYIAKKTIEYCFGINEDPRNYVYIAKTEEAL